MVGRGRWLTVRLFIPKGEVVKHKQPKCIDMHIPVTSCQTIASAARVSLLVYKVIGLGRKAALLNMCHRKVQWPDSISQNQADLSNL